MNVWWFFFDRIPLLFNGVYGPLPFDDVYGTILGIGILVSALLAFLVKATALYVPTSSFPDATKLFRVFFGIGLIFWGCWIFGDKIRFAEQPVIKTEATITDLWGLSHGYIDYQYEDDEGHLHKGVEILVTRTRHYSYKKGDKVPIYYLIASPNISRLVEEHYMRIYFVRLFLILAGGITILGGISKRWKIGPFSVNIDVGMQPRADE